MPFKRLALLKISQSSYIKSLNNLDSTPNIRVNRPPEIINHHRILVSLQLHIIEIIVINACDDILWHVICKDTKTLYTPSFYTIYLLTTLLQITIPTVIWNNSGVTGNHFHNLWRVRTKHKTQYINIRCEQFSNVFSITNTANTN